MGFLHALHFYLIVWRGQVGTLSGGEGEGGERRSVTGSALVFGLATLNNSSTQRFRIDTPRKQWQQIQDISAEREESVREKLELKLAEKRKTSKALVRCFVCSQTLSLFSILFLFDERRNGISRARREEEANRHRSESLTDNSGKYRHRNEWNFEKKSSSLLSLLPERDKEGSDVARWSEDEKKEKKTKTKMKTFFHLITNTAAAAADFSFGRSFFCSLSRTYGRLRIEDCSVKVELALGWMGMMTARAREKKASNEQS